jgi:hypothetical protein
VASVGSLHNDRVPIPDRSPHERQSPVMFLNRYEVGDGLASKRNVGFTGPCLASREAEPARIRLVVFLTGIARQSVGAMILGDASGIIEDEIESGTLGAERPGHVD